MREIAGITKAAERQGVRTLYRRRSGGFQFLCFLSYFAKRRSRSDSAALMRAAFFGCAEKSNAAAKPPHSRGTALLFRAGAHLYG